MGSDDAAPPDRDAKHVIPIQRVLLVGFMGSGKSTTGPLLAERLGWEFLDFDREIEKAAGATIPVIFRDRGEASFRRMEGKMGESLIERRGAVLSSGGGWPATPGRMESIGPETFAVWLQVSPEAALRRIRLSMRDPRDPAAVLPLRPLLDRPDALAEARRILEERALFYARARLILDTEVVTPSEIADQVVRHLDAHSLL